MLDINKKNKLLSSWVEITQGVMLLKEEELWDLLEVEKTGKRRVQFLIRIFGRANKLRTIRETKELLQ